MAKQLVTVIDSSGKKFKSRLTWAESKRAKAECVLGYDGIYRFPSHSQRNDGAGSISGLAVHRERSIRFAVQLRPNEPTPNHDSFLPYPYADRTSGRGLRAQYPALREMGAGLG